MLHVSDHAVERFIRHSRRGMGADEARETLEVLVARSAATKRRTLPGDAWVHVGFTDRGEAVHFAVRDHTIVTVLRPSACEARELRVVGCEAPADLEAVQADRARLADRIETECARQRAEAIVAAWTAGEHVRHRALRRAREVLSASSAAGTEPTTKRAA
jgi:hypothetical protein